MRNPWQGGVRGGFAMTGQITARSDDLARIQRPILGRLIELYRDEGIEICTGLPPPHFQNLAAINFTWFLKDGRSLTKGLGIALQEIYFLEVLFAAYRPKHVAVIGNSLGWSTLAIAMLLRDATVAALDSGHDGMDGFDITHRIAKKEGLNVRVVQGTSPQDVEKMVDADLGGRIDFSFVDGFHANEQIILDFKALRDKADEHSVYLFHDVHMFDLYSGLAEIERLSGWNAVQLRATSSGMAIICDWTHNSEVKAAIAPFAPSFATQKIVEQESRLLTETFKQKLSRRFRRLAAWT
jgi:Methyltransferase domain